METMMRSKVFSIIIHPMQVYMNELHTQNKFNIFNKTHPQHFISFIKDTKLQRAEINIFPLYVILHKDLFEN